MCPLTYLVRPGLVVSGQSAISLDESLSARTQYSHYLVYRDFVKTSGYNKIHKIVGIWQVLPVETHN
jgi:hypothetical protein